MARDLTYEKLPGKGLRRGFSALLAGVSRLYLAKDHLLLVDSNGGFSEAYKRFYFPDIQAISITRTKGRAIRNIIYGVLAVCFGLPCVFSNIIGIQITFGVPLAAILSAIAINSLRGPMCVCQIVTAVQAEELASLKRLKLARKVVSRLSPIIREAQGSADSTENA